MNTIPLFAPGAPTHRRNDESYAREHPRVAAKLDELRSRTICYNRELARLSRELAEVRAATASAQNC